jgi:uncharacterized membrane protein
MGDFLEITKAYYKWHLYFFVVSITAICGLLSLLNGIFLLISIMGLGLTYMFRDIQLGWSDRKILNLMTYRSSTRTTYTPLEQKMLNKYFGEKTRNEIIITQDQIKKVFHKILGLEALIIIIISILLIPYALAFLAPSTLPTTYSMSGLVNSVEYRYAAGLFGLPSTNPSETIIHFQNDNLILKTYVQLSIGYNYTIKYDSNGKCVSIMRY